MQVFQGNGRLALIGAAVLALALAGCGRKSSLDLPPQAAAQAKQAQADGQPPAAPPRTNQLGLFDPTQEDTQPYVPGQKRRIILDHILD